MQAKNILPLLASGFVLGITVRSFFSLSLGVAVLCFFLGLVFAFYGLVRPFHRHSALLPVIAFLLLGAAIGAGYYHLKVSRAREALLQIPEGRVQLRGLIVAEPDERDTYTRLVFLARALHTTGGVERIRVKVLLTVASYPQFHYGDELEVSGTLRVPRSSSDFDWRAYLAKDDILFESYRPTVTLRETGGGWFFIRALLSLKRAYVDALSRILPEPHASFLAGLTVGARKSMPTSLQETFRRAGVIHLVVLSGYNVTIVAENIMRMLGVFARSGAISFLGGVAGVLAFALLAGASPTVLRASLMALLVLVARATGRTYTVSVALIVAGLLMLAANPRLLRFDPSFQLSFLASLGLIYIAPQVERFFTFLPQRFGIRGHASATVSAQLAVFPLLLASMGDLSLVAPGANLLILLFIPATMFIGSLAGVVGIFSSLLAAPFAWAAYALLNYELAVAEFFSRLPFASVHIAAFSWVFVWMIYVGYAVALFRLRLRDRKREHTSI
ncbi:MAG: ComEC/Rec2 family competence protein [Parcubacteria group bacterium]|nr:ComEC/Rec2 family competence protein [Parcubacteria group bacterium]